MSPVWPVVKTLGHFFFFGGEGGLIKCELLFWELLNFSI